MKKVATKADSLKNSEENGMNLDTILGARPLRKKAYHRAIKQGKAWAVSLQKDMSYRQQLFDMWAANFQMLIVPPHLMKVLEEVGPYEGSIADIPWKGKK